MAYKGKYTIKDTKKYLGDPTKVTYRSLWERQAFKWCENNPRVKRWNSEEIVVPYKCKTDGKLHRYFVDLLVEFDNKDIILVEIKPKKETVAPKKPATPPALKTAPQRNCFALKVEINRHFILIATCEIKLL